jgi:hypothetical protein
MCFVAALLAAPLLNGPAGLVIVCLIIALTVGKAGLIY